ncbi:MAG TPA: PD-(D/E)XK nuclease family protein [Lacunisphaera sp.]
MTPPAPDRRHFLSWARPLLPQAADFLAGDWDGKGPLDLSRVMVVVPTKQAGRRLREALADHAAQRGQGVFAPRVMTPDALLSSQTDATVASRLDSLLAWCAVFRDLRLDEFREVFPVDPPLRNFSWTLRLAQEFGGLQTNLAEGGLRITDVVAKTGESFAERPRWQQLRELELRHDAVLARAGLIDDKTARIVAAGKPWLTDIDRIVLLAVPDPLPLALVALETHAVSIPTTVAVFAAPDEEGNFDAWGRPMAERWEQRELRLEEFESRVHVCGDPVTQGDRLAETAQQYEPREGWVAFGIADPEILAPLEGALQRFRIAVFNPEGSPRRQEGLHQLLSTLADLTRDPAFSNVEALGRCPDFIFYLEGKSDGTFSVKDWLDGLDKLRAEHLPGDLAGALKQASKPGNDLEVANGLRAMDALREKLRENDFEAGATAVLAEIYQGREIDLKTEESSRFESAATAWMETLRACAEARERFGDLAAGDWWELALRTFGDSVWTAEKPEGALELQGWLELAWENAPHLMVAGLNDGRVPEAVIGDAFLPESLRARLGLKTNPARFARDAYLLQALASSRASGGRLDLFFGKNSLAGEPLRPSRLLLRGPDEGLPSRVAFLFRTPEKNEQPIPWHRAWQLKPRREEPPARVAVTGLKAWLECPFRFYLRHGLKMNAIDPAKNELDAFDFGTLCHGALEGLAGPAMRDCADELTLKNFLLSEFDRLARDKYGTALSLPLLIQIESARQRLAKVAEVQARERADGWVIIAVERKIEILCEGIVIRGRIDRIERHETTGQVRVLDYKTSDTAIAPREAHLRSLHAEDTLPDWARITVDDRERGWVDLQLPLYRDALAAEFGPDIACAYFNLPKAASETGLLLWENFSLELQESAMRCARGICASIKAGIFWPPNEKVKAERDDFAALFQHGVAASVDWEVSP